MTTIETPVGGLRLSADGHSLTEIYFTDAPAQSAGDSEPTGVLAEVCRQLEEYFAGTRTTFDLPLSPHGTEFQQRVWAELREIPYGCTVSYGEIAARLGLPPGGARAVGLANGANPIPIVIPCHRVIGADGSLTGYGGGIDRKRALLALEAPAAAQGSLFA